MALVRRRALDCAKYTRVQYVLPEPVTAELAALFPEAEVRLNAFSRFVRGAHDQLALAVAGQWRGTGVIGADDFVVVYFHDTNGHPAEADTGPEAEDNARDDAGSAAATTQHSNAGFAGRLLSGIQAVEHRLMTRFGRVLDDTDHEPSSAAAHDPAAPSGPRIPLRRLNVTDLVCPLPVRRTRHFLETLAVGDEILVLATDASAMIDFQHFCNTTPHMLLASSEDDGVFRFHIRCGETGRRHG